MTSSLSFAAERSTRTAERTRRNPTRDIAALVALAVCALILHRDGLGGGPAFYELDTRLFYFPLAQWVSQQLHAGSFPLWLPGIFNGYPIFADGELGLAYLPQIALLGLLPAPLAMVWLRVLHTFLAGALTYAYLRNLRLEPLPALGGGLVFALGSFVSAQMHHENVVRSAVWLPAVLLCLDRAVRAVPRSVFVWVPIGAICFAQAALGLHVQPVLMAALAIALYGLFRALLPGETAYWALGSCAAIVFGGIAVAAVQWLPLGEWALVSSRRGGVDYTFASAFALPPVDLVSLIFPFFFRLADATTWWSLWQQWEIELYVGVPTLALAIVGLLFARRVEVVYCVVLGGLSLWIAMAEYAPWLNLHQVLWDIPGFSFLRAPGRFIYLVVFACACFAAFGLQALNQRRLRLLIVLAGGVPAVGALAALLAVLPSWRDWLAADSSRAAAWAQATYLVPRAQYLIDPRLVVAGMLTSLDPTNIKTAWSLALLALTALAFVAWLALGPSRAMFGQGIFVGLIAIDLLVFAYDFHPRASFETFTPTLDGVGGQRVLLHDPADLPAYEPDQLLAAGIPLSDGYSSLPSQRHVEVQAATSADPRLFDLWSAPAIVEPPNPSDLRTVDGVRFRAEHPLVAGFGGATPQTLQVPPRVGSISTIRVIGTLGYAFNVPQGQTVARLEVDGESLPLRAGVELSERAVDRPSLTGLMQHRKVRVALDFDEVTSEGEDYTAHLYEADLPLASPRTLASIIFAPSDPSVQVELEGVAVVDTAGSVTSLDLSNRAGMQRVNDTVIRDIQALPRAFVLPRAQAFSPGRHPGLTAPQLVASPDVDLHSMVLIENDPNAPSAPNGSEAVAPAQSVEDLGPNTVRITATADGPSYLVLDDFYHRGWTARVDGQAARVLIANALFRAVAIDAGTHVVEFRFQPLSQLIGAVVSAISLVVAGGAIVWGVWRPRGTLRL